MSGPELPASPLSKDAARQLSAGAGWVLFSRGLVRGSDLLKVAALAHFLAPADFGVLGVAMLALMSLEAVTETGVSAALVHRPGDIRDHLDTAFTLQCMRGFIVAGLVYGIAPAIGAFFATPPAIPVLRVLSVFFLIRSLQNPGIILYTRSVNFHPLFMWSLVEAVAGVGAALLALSIFRDVWVLVVSVLVAQTARSVATYVLHPYRPRIHFVTPRAKELLSFGRWVTISNVLIFLVANGDAAFVAKMLDAASLGLYQVAYQFANTPATYVSNSVAQVTFPWYVQARDELDQFRRFLWHAIKRVSLIALPIAAVTAAWSSQLVILVLGEQWIEMVPVVRILCLFGAVRAINGCWGSVYQAAGRPEILAKVTGLQVLVMILLVPPLTLHLGIVGTAVGTTLANVVTLLTAAAQGLRITHAKVADLLRAVAPGVGLSIAILVVGAVVGLLLPSHWTAWQQLTAHVGGMGLLAAFGCIFWRNRVQSVLAAIRASH